MCSVKCIEWKMDWQFCKLNSLSQSKRMVSTTSVRVCMCVHHYLTWWLRSLSMVYTILIALNHYTVYLLLFCFQGMKQTQSIFGDTMWWYKNGMCCGSMGGLLCQVMFLSRCFWMSIYMFCLTLIWIWGNMCIYIYNQHVHGKSTYLYSYSVFLVFQNITAL